MNIKLTCVLSAIIIATFSSCIKPEEPIRELSDPDDVANAMNASLEILAPDVYEVNEDEVSSTNTVTIINANSGSVIPIEDGQTMTNNIQFQSTVGDVAAVGMRFGTSGPIYMVPVDANGVSSGIASFDFLIDQGICDDLSSICHDIRCYEFAQTTSGAISRANIMDVAMLCGNCDEPSCSSLINNPQCQQALSGADGSPRFNLTWTGSTDLDLYVIEPNGETLNYINSLSSSGGELDIDCTGSCTGGNSENITWVNGGSSGTYQYYVDYFSGSQTTSFNITITDNGTVVGTQSGSLSSGQSSRWSYNK